MHRSILKALIGAVIVSVGSAAVPVAAQQADEPSALCHDAGSMVETSECLQIAVERADLELNETFKKITAVLHDNENKLLRAAQRAWIVFRDTGCEAEASLYNGGSGKGITRQACLEAMTRDRVSSLRRGFWWRVEKFGDGS